MVTIPDDTTKAGVAADTELLARVSEHRRRVSSDITPQQYQATVEVLGRMAANPGWVDPAGQPAR